LERALDALERDPRPAGKHVKAIRGTRDAFLRYRVGDYRVLYEVFDAASVVLVHGIIQRKDLEDWLRRQG
jgi:mRNA interferase RelE/StbE